MHHQIPVPQTHMRPTGARRSRGSIGTALGAQEADEFGETCRRTHMTSIVAAWCHLRGAQRGGCRSTTGWEVIAHCRRGRSAWSASKARAGSGRRRRRPAAAARAEGHAQTASAPRPTGTGQTLGHRGVRPPARTRLPTPRRGIAGMAR